MLAERPRSPLDRYHDAPGLIHVGHGHVLDQQAKDSFDQPDIQFVDRSIDPRVVGPKGNEHTRRFLPDDGYAAVATRVLRKADGTAFVIFPDGAGPFASGQYRLGLTYRRDISTSDANASLLSESGVDDPEQTQIDIPWLTVP